jgi:hypothetical protein
MVEAEDSGTGPQKVPWYIWCSVAAVTSAIVGTHWDISWHRSIGRDTFWTPAHIAIYLCGALAGTASGYLILLTTAGAPGVAPAARNPVLGSIYFDFNIHPASSYVKHLFYSTEQTTGQFWAGMAAAAACAVASTWAGLAWGDWMTRIRR